MKKLLLAFVSVSIICLLTPLPALAHHGYAAYDLTRILKLKGAVTDYELMNPHSMMEFDVKDDHDKLENWIAEAGHIRLMRDEGWTANTLKVGDVVIFSFHPAKNGSHSVDLVSVEFPDGRVLWAHSSHEKTPTDF